MPTVGVLGLQGAFVKHLDVLQRIKVTPCVVRYPEDLRDCDALIIPGGESTTLTKLIDFIGLREKLLEFARSRPVMGTCAGMIMMARDVKDPRVKPLGLVNIQVSRNAYGRQIDSFIESLNLRANGKSVAIKGVFIRAPKIVSVGNEVEVLGSIEGEIVFVRQGKYLATTFHPELSESSAIHEYFISLIGGSGAK